MENKAGQLLVRGRSSLRIKKRSMHEKHILREKLFCAILV